MGFGESGPAAEWGVAGHAGAAGCVVEVVVVLPGGGGGGGGGGGAQAVARMAAITAPAGMSTRALKAIADGFLS